MVQGEDHFGIRPDYAGIPPSGRAHQPGQASVMLGDIAATDSIAIAPSGLKLSVTARGCCVLDMHRVETGQIMDLSNGIAILRIQDSGIETGALETYLWKTASYGLLQSSYTSLRIRC